MSKHLSEGDQIPNDLTPYWMEAIGDHRLIFAGRPQHRCVRWLMEHIVAQGYSKQLVPYTSIVRLLISIPNEGRVNYSSSLYVGYDDLEQHVVLKHRANGSIIWTMTCQASELIDTFEHFLNEHPDWSCAARNK